MANVVTFGHVEPQRGGGGTGGNLETVCNQIYGI